MAWRARASASIHTSRSCGEDNHGNFKSDSEPGPSQTCICYIMHVRALAGISFCRALSAIDECLDTRKHMNCPCEARTDAGLDGGGRMQAQQWQRAFLTFGNLDFVQAAAGPDPDSQQHQRLLACKLLVPCTTHVHWCMHMPHRSNNELHLACSLPVAK